MPLKIRSPGNPGSRFRLSPEILPSFKTTVTRLNFFFRVRSAVATLNRIALSFAVVGLLALSLRAAELRGRWEVRAPMPSARTEVAAAESGDKIYVIGGYQQFTDRLEEYNPARDSWRRRASLPRPLHHVGAASLGGKIYVIGGYAPGKGAVNTAYEYDPATDHWRLLAPMPTARGALAIGVAGGKIYAIGGVG